MGRIGQSLIMLGQPPYCSLFSVCQADDGLRVCVGVGVYRCVRVCEHKHALCKMGQGYGREKDPTLSYPPPPCFTSMPLQIGFYITEAVRYEQLIFLSLFLPFLSFIPLFYFLASFFLGLSFFVFLFFLLSLFLSFFPSASSSSWKCEHCTFSFSFSSCSTGLVVSVHGWVNSAVDVWFAHLPV